MNGYCEKFLNFLSEEKRYSFNTCQSYLRDVRQYVDFCNLIYVENITDTDSLTIKKYIDNLDSSGKSKSTQMRILASLRCYYSFLYTKSLVKSKDIVKNVRIDINERKLPEVLNNEEILQIINQAKGNDIKSIRDKAMMELMYATGIKVSELICLKVEDVVLQVGVLRISDGKTERVIPIYPQALKSLTLYIKSARPLLIFDDENSLLFANMSGQPLSRQGFWKIIKLYASKANISKEITPYTFRHSFAANLLQNGADLNDIKEMLGHSDISTTGVYTQILKNKYALSYKKFHPMAQQ